MHEIRNKKTKNKNKNNQFNVALCSVQLCSVQWKVEEDFSALRRRRSLIPHSPLFSFLFFSSKKQSYCGFEQSGLLVFYRAPAAAVLCFFLSRFFSFFIFFQIFFNIKNDFILTLHYIHASKTHQYTLH